VTRSPLAYPLNRGVDGDAGGAADLQTDIMRFMAILALCLVAIFALVQSIPLVPEPPTVSEPVPQRASTPPAREVLVPKQPMEPAEPPPETILLTRPQWRPLPRTEQPAPSPPPVIVATEPAAAPVPEPPAPTASEKGFTLRFESDLALTRLVASSQVGFYAIAAGRAQRMTVSDSRISFWDASVPNKFHEMEAATVPSAVVEALGRTGADTSSVDWGVTLPNKLSRQLDEVMRENTGGSLVIAADGELRLEST